MGKSKGKIQTIVKKYDVPKGFIDKKGTFQALEEKPKTSLVEKVKNAYNKATGRKTISMEMDGKTFTGTDKMGVRRGVTKVSNPTAGSRKIVDTYTSEGNLKRQKIVDKFPDGTRRVTKSGPDKDAIWQKEQTKLMRKKKG